MSSINGDSVSKGQDSSQRFDWRSGLIGGLLIASFFLAIHLLDHFINEEILTWLGKLTAKDVLWSIGLLLAVVALGLGCTWVWGKVSADREGARASRYVASLFVTPISDLDGHVRNLGEIPGRLDEANNGLRQRIEGVDGIVKRLEAAVVKSESVFAKDIWLSRPGDYANLIKCADEMPSGGGEHIKTITLLGTMVGFAFLLPEAIRYHACRSEGKFNVLKLIASDAEVPAEHGGEGRKLFYYPLYLIASLVRDLFAKCTNFAGFFEKGQNGGFDIETVYTANDMIPAAILLEDREIATLQALDSKTFKAILEGKELQPGFRYQNDEARKDAFNRLRYAVEDLAKNGAPEICRELWQFRSENNVIVLSVQEPHWKLDGKIITILSTQRYRSTSSDTVRIVGKDEIVGVVEALLSKIRSEPGSGEDIQEIEGLLAQSQNCPCNVATACR